MTISLYKFVQLYLLFIFRLQVLKYISITPNFLKVIIHNNHYRYVNQLSDTLNSKVVKIIAVGRLYVVNSMRTSSECHLTNYYLFVGVSTTAFPLHYFASQRVVAVIVNSIGDWMSEAVHCSQSYHHLMQLVIYELPDTIDYFLKQFIILIYFLCKTSSEEWYELVLINAQNQLLAPNINVGIVEPPNNKVVTNIMHNVVVIITCLVSLLNSKSPLKPKTTNGNILQARPIKHRIKLQMTKAGSKCNLKLNNASPR
ncbi:hypothetical protein AGLY_005882 [Aphis glycines]|uniref:Uncharacterized protein n=1 Tax=Aphis glycines TaxID=307491 RepID=A0A6G0TT30_APHGL|nr:hypothetical protein AGLY_005882 [Aphis glycines]